MTVGHTLGRIADPHKAVQDYKHKPFSTFMEDITIPSIVLPIAAGAASAGLRPWPPEPVSPPGMPA